MSNVEFDPDAVYFNQFARLNIDGLDPGDAPDPSTYVSIDTPTETRIITLFPGTPTDSILVAIKKIDLAAEGNPPFEALSYVWGNQDDPVCIHVVSEPAGVLFIGQPLAQALRNLRYTYQSRTLWVDALAINQRDLQEKSNHVARMGKIYRAASRVIVWLGLESEDSAHALDMMHDLGTKIDVDWGNTNTMQSSQAFQHEPHWADLGRDLHFPHQTMRAVYNLLHRQWFERLWVRQEIFLARNAILLCGRKAVPWKTFRNAIYLISYKGPDAFEDRSSEFYMTDQRELILHMAIPEQYLPLNHLLFSAQMSKCADPRDRIYGLLSLLTSEGLQVGIVPDYKLTPDRVFQDLVMSQLRTIGCIELICCCRIPNLAARQPTLPSWVPNWLDTARPSPFYLNRADGNISATASIIERGVLQVSGVYISPVSEVIDMHEHIDARPRLRNCVAKLHAMVRRDGLDSLYVTQDRSLLDAICDAFCAGICTENVEKGSDEWPNRIESTRFLRTVLDPESTYRSGARGSAEERLRAAFEQMAYGRTFFKTRSGHVGLGPLYMQPGDEVAVLLGAQSPLILRRGVTNSFQIVGDAYIPGLETGQALLGRLPPHYNMVMYSQSALFLYMNKQRDIFEKTDPRVPGFLQYLGVPPGTVDEDGRIHVTAHQLRSKGLGIVDFFLV
jgi:hypothetical protein